MEKPEIGHTRIELLEGEAEIDKLGDERRGLLLTNKRVIRSSREGRTNTTTIAFVQDIVTAGIAHTGRNRMLLFFGILLALAGLGWYIGSGDSVGELARNIGLAVGLVLGVVLVVRYLLSGGAQIVIRTATGGILFHLSHRASARAYTFINRLSILKDSVTRRAA
jgi:hypothetical protein